jgi:hypothetical protein
MWGGMILFEIFSKEWNIAMTKIGGVGTYKDFEEKEVNKSNCLYNRFLY